MNSNLHQRFNWFRRIPGGWNFVLTLAVLVSAGGIAHAEELPEHVVLICIDGLPGEFLSDPAVPLDAIRDLASQGVSALGMKVTNPSVTWPNHTSLLTGVRPIEHGVLFNGVMRRQGYGMPVQLDPRTDQSELVRVSTLPDELHSRGKTVVGINWPCTRNSQSLRIDFPDTPDALTFTTPSFLDEMIHSGTAPANIRDSFRSMSPIMRDRLWTQAACLALRQHRPALTLIHLLNVDATHHRYGPKTWGGYAAVAYADTCVGQILRTLDEAGMRPKTAVFIVSDHGFLPIPKTIHPNVTLRKAGLLTVEGNRITSASAQAIAEGGTAMVFLTRPDARQAISQQVVDLFESEEGIAAVLTPDQFAEHGLPRPDEYTQMGDLILVAREGYGFKDQFTGDAVVTPSEGTLGTHGFLASHPSMNAIFVASGAGIQSGLQLEVFENICVAPTIAKLLNVELPAAEGTPLNKILRNP